MSRNVIDEFEDLINEKAKKLAELKELEAEIESRAPAVLKRASETDEPVDVHKVVGRLGSGLSVEEIAGDPIPLDEEDIETFHGEITEDVRRRQERRRKAVMAAASVVAGSASRVIGVL